MALSLTSRSALRTLNVENKQKNIQAQKSSTSAVKTSLFRDLASEGKGLSFAGCSKPGLKVHVWRKSHFIYVLILSLLLTRMHSHVCEKGFALAWYNAAAHNQCTQPLQVYCLCVPSLEMCGLIGWGNSDVYQRSKENHSCIVLFGDYNHPTCQHRESNLRLGDGKVSTLATELTRQPVFNSKLEYS